MRKVKVFDYGKHEDGRANVDLLVHQYTGYFHGWGLDADGDQGGSYTAAIVQREKDSRIFLVPAELVMFEDPPCLSPETE